MKLGTILQRMDWIGDCGHDEIDMHTDINQNIFREMMTHMRTRNTLELTMKSKGYESSRVGLHVLLRFGERHVHYRG